MPPNGVFEIGAMVTPDWDVVAWDEWVDGPVPKELLENSQLIALTGLTPSRYRAIDIADSARELGLQVIAGGRDVIGRSREDGGVDELHEHYPSICTTVLTPDMMAEILADAANHRLKPVYALPEGETIRMVMPRRDLLDPKRYFAGWALRSSEGCNRNCPWCTVGGRGYFFKNPAVLEAELRTIHSDFFLDMADSFAGNPRYTIENILPIYTRSKKQWGTEIAVADLLGTESGIDMTGPMAAAGCRLVYIGIESVTRRVNKKSSREMAEEAIKACRKAGMLVIGSLILDTIGDETIEEIEETAEWAAQWLDFAQFSLVALLPGCTLKRQALIKNTMIEEDLEKFDGANPTQKHQLEPGLRRHLLEKSYRDFSRMKWILARTWRAPKRYKHLVFLSGLRYRRGIPKP